MKRTTLLILFLLVGLVACDEAPTPTPTPVPPTPTPTPEDWLDNAIQTWNATESVHFTLDVEGRTITLDEEGLLSFTSVEGNVVAPDRMEAETVVQTPMGNVEMSYITIGDNQWLTDPLTGEWQQVPPGMEVGVGEIFDPTSGIGALLANLDNLERLPDETLDETATVRLRGTLPGAALVEFAPDLAEQEEVQVDLWIAAEDHRIHRILLTEPEQEGVTPTWTFQFSDFDEPMTIEPPQ